MAWSQPRTWTSTDSVPASLSPEEVVLSAQEMRRALLEQIQMYVTTGIVLPGPARAQAVGPTPEPVVVTYGGKRAIALDTVPKP